MFAGGPVAAPWGSFKAALMCYLPGQAGAGAAFDVLFGRISPSGKLAESFPLSYSDVASKDFFGQESVVEYRESVFVGYRRYAGAGVKTAFPFGHGLSYASFSYSGMEAAPGDAVNVSLTIKNVGEVEGAEVCQLYVAPPKSPVFRPAMELKGFRKIRLKPGESAVAEFSLDRRDFSFWNPITHKWQVIPGEYRIMAGSSSESIRLEKAVAIEGDSANLPDFREKAPELHDPARIGSMSRKSFEAVLGREVPVHSPLPITRFSSLNDVRLTFLGRMLCGLLKGKSAEGGGAAPQEGQDLQVMLDAQAGYVPLYALVAFTGGAVTFEVLDGIIMAMNGQYARGAIHALKEFLKARRNRRIWAGR
jgi:beta-glucosidase